MLSAFYKTHIVLPLPRGLELGSDYSVFPAFFLSAVIFVFLLLYLKNVYTTSYFLLTLLPFISLSFLFPFKPTMASFYSSPSSPCSAAKAEA